MSIWASHLGSTMTILLRG